MTNAVCIGPFPVLLPPPNARHGRKVFDGGSLVSQQRAMVRAAFSGRCSVCGVPRTAVRPRGAQWSGALYTYGCQGHVARVVPYQLPPHGPEHPVDVHLVRVAKHGGGPLDPHDNRPFVFKPIVDEATEQLWPNGKSAPNDSARWLRWSYGERPHRKAKSPRRMTQRPDWVPGPPDPPNRGIELCEIWIAEREDCGGKGTFEQQTRAVAAWLRGLSGADGDGLVEFDRALLSASLATGDIRELLKANACGCGRSMLPIRWARGKL